MWVEWRVASSGVDGVWTRAALLERAAALATRGERAILGITGAPGAGKSTLAQWLADELGDDAVLVPMDGFHLANEVLIALGRRDRKGAPDTFDAAGYVAMLERLRSQDDEVVYAPRFDREIEESIGSAIPVARSVRLVVTEGNYLLLAQDPWSRIRSLLDEAWFLMPADAVRHERLIARHMAFGKTEEEARAWSMGSDERNAVVIRATADVADLVIDLT